MSAAFIITPERRAALHAIRDSIPGSKRASQKLRILTAIQQLGSVTTFEAMRHLDVYDPRPRKMELVQDGHPIILSWDRMTTESGSLHRIGRYLLAREQGTEATV